MIGDLVMKEIYKKLGADYPESITRSELKDDGKNEITISYKLKRGYRIDAKTLSNILTNLDGLVYEIGKQINNKMRAKLKIKHISRRGNKIIFQVVGKIKKKTIFD